MKATYQHKCIAQHIHNTLGNLPHWPFNSAAEVERELCRMNLSIAAADYLVVSIERNSIGLGKVRGLEGLTAFPAHSWVISYHELERAFHEQHTHWVEF